MNKKELKGFVAADREIIEKEMSEKIKRIFLNILGVEPDKVFPKMTYEFNGSYHTFTGHLCTLDGAEFFCGEENWFGSCASNSIYTAIYQRIDVTIHEVNWLGRPKPKTRIEYKRIRRPADILV